MGASCGSALGGSAVGGSALGRQGPVAALGCEQLAALAGWGNRLGVADVNLCGWQMHCASCLEIGGVCQCELRSEIEDRAACVSVSCMCMRQIVRVARLVIAQIIEKYQGGLTIHISPKRKG